MKKLSNLFGFLAVILSDAVCAAIGYNYCDLEWRGMYEGFSGSPSVAIFLAIPYIIGITACVLLALFFRMLEKNKRV